MPKTIPRPGPGVGDVLAPCTGCTRPSALHTHAHTKADKLLGHVCASFYHQMNYFATVSYLVTQNARECEFTTCTKQNTTL